MDIIKQTNRAILFEEFNPEKPDLITLVEDVKGKIGLDDEKIKEINNHLLVSSFEEFLTRFSPVVYSYYDAGAKEPKVIYTLEKPPKDFEEYVSEIKLDQNNEFLNMLLTLISNASSQGSGHVGFDFDTVLDMISPKKVVESVKQVRKEIHYLYEKFESLEDGSFEKLELGDKLNEKFEEASESYNNVMSMLPLAIEDIDKRLFLGQAQNGKNGAGSQKIKPGMLSLGDNGELKVIEAAKSESTALVALGEGVNDKLVELFEGNYDDVVKTPSKYAKDLVVRTFCPLPATTEIEIDEQKEIENYNSYINFYKDANDDFIKVSKPLLEKVLGVRQFFAQYNTRNAGMKPTLLITNNKLENMVSNKNYARLDLYLKAVNSTTYYNDTIWFGIVPDVDMEEKEKEKKKPTKSMFAGTNKNKTVDKGNSVGDLASLLNILKEYKIQLFFNFKASEETSFNDMALHGVEKYYKRCEDLVDKSFSEYAIVCLPNFTILPKKKSGIYIGKEIDIKEQEDGKLTFEYKEDKLKIWIDSVHIGAAYVAAGIVGAYQCPQYLKEFFREPKQVNPNYPGVRFNIESGDNNLKIITTMAKEIKTLSDEVKNSIDSGTGFVFSSEKEKITVYKARNLKTMENGGYEPIYRTLVTTYVERMIKNETEKFKEDKVKKFFRDTSDSRIKNWNDNTDYVNSILEAKGDLSCDIKDGSCPITMKFNGVSTPLDVEIIKSEKSSDSGKK